MPRLVNEDELEGSITKRHLLSDIFRGFPLVSTSGVSSTPVVELELRAIELRKREMVRRLGRVRMTL